MPGARPPRPPSNRGVGPRGRRSAPEPAVRRRGYGPSVAALLLAVALAGTGLAYPVAGEGLGRAPVRSGAPSDGGGLRAAAASPPVAPETGSGCSSVFSAWQALYAAGPTPPSVYGANNGSSCVVGPDEEGVALISNESPSGMAFEVTVSLPSASDDPAVALDQFFVSAAVSGLPCSLDGLSLLRIDLIPPNGANGSPDGWLVRAPIWDLAPVGTCDPRCTNGTADYQVAGGDFCLDDSVVAGMGSPSYTALPVLAPGNVVRFTVTSGAGRDLTVYENDSTDRALSKSWSYSEGTLLDGGSAQPYDPLANPRAGWSFSGSVGYGWTNCPVLASNGLPVCDSYDASVDTGLDFPEVVNASYWNDFALAYTSPFSTESVWSSSGGCSGQANLTECVDFDAEGGESAYPSLHVAASGGSAGITYGSNSSGVVGPLAPGGFAPSGGLAPAEPALLSGVSASANATNVSVTVRATDPRGLASVDVGAAWCFSTGGSTVPSALTVNATASTTPGNGSEDADYTAVFPRGDNATGGTFYYSLVEFPDGGGPATPPVYGTLALASSGLTCGALNPSPATLTHVAPISGGYSISWFAPDSDAPLVRNFSLVATPPGGPSVVIPIPDALDRSLVVGSLDVDVAYDLALDETLVDGTTASTGPAVPYPATLEPESVLLSASSNSLLEPGAVDSFTASAFGGEPPYSFDFALGNGSQAFVNGSSSGIVTVVPGFGGVGRIAPVSVSVSDSVGDVAVSSPINVSVNATAQGVPLTESTGEGAVELTWQAPTSISAPVTRYVVFYTTSPVGAGMMGATWPANGTGPDAVSMWNTTSTSLGLSVPDGDLLYAEVIAWNEYGPGLPPAAGPSGGLPAPFALTEFAPAPGTAYGGPAPFQASVTAQTTEGALDPLTTGLYTVFEISPVPGPVSVPIFVTLQSSSNSTATSGYANASIDFNDTGAYLVLVHLDDAFLDPTLIPALYLYVGAGIEPSAGLSVTTRQPFSGTPVDFTASATGSPGPYNYTWEFGDGTVLVDAGPNVEHTFASAGTFTVGVSVLDNSTGGIAFASLSVVVFSAPVVEIASGEGNAGPLSFAFRAVEYGGSGPGNVDWTFGDGTSANGAQVNHTYAAAGQYTVKVRLTDPSGLVATDNITVYAGVAPSSAGTALTTTIALALLLVALLALVAVGAFAVVYYRRARRLQREASLAQRPTYPEDRSPPPKDEVT